LHYLHSFFNCFSSASASHLKLTATPQSLPRAGTAYTDILGLTVLHTITNRRKNRIRDLSWYRVS
jgi:hypothetical protein